jgi:hypothetical protein
MTPDTSTERAASGRVAPRPIPPLLRRIAVTLLIGAPTYLITNSAQDNQLWAIGLSAFVGGVTLVVQFLVEVDARLDRLEEQQATRLASVQRQQTARLEALEQQQAARLRAVQETQAAYTKEIRDLVQQSFLKINQATELFGLVEASALRTDAVIQLVQHSTQLSSDPSLVSRVAQAEIVRTSRFLKELADGTASYEGEDRDWLLALAENTKISIDATSLNTVDTRGSGLDSSFWKSDLGQRYLEVQRSLVRSGIKIRRVFIVDRPDLANSPDFLTICERQAEMGIEVRILNASGFGAPLTATVFDFILFDNIISYETTPAYPINNSSPPGIVHTRLQLQPDVVEDRIERYRDLWQSAKPFAVDRAPA